MITIYHNPKCSKSRETLKLLQDRNIQPQIIEYLKTPPSVDELRLILAKLGKSPRDLVRKKDAADAEIQIDALDDEGVIAAMVAHPAIMERPIVIVGDKAALGRPPEAVLILIPTNQ